MPEIIKQDGSIVDDAWVVVPHPDAGESLQLGEGPSLIPAELWLAHRDAYAGRSNIGVWLDSHEEPEMLEGAIADVPVIAVNFPKFTDGRGYSVARILRERLGYKNELRAIGDVLLDQLQFMKRCGFDSFKLREDKDITKAPACLEFFSINYQAAGDTDTPLFRRRLEA